MKFKSWKCPMLICVWALFALFFCTSSFGKLLEEFVNVQSRPPQAGAVEPGYNRFPQQQQLTPEQERIVNQMATTSGWGALGNMIRYGWH
jgi:hypothetical protein